MSEEQMRTLPEQVVSMMRDRIPQTGKKQENKTCIIVMKFLLSEDKQLILSHKKYF